MPSSMIFASLVVLWLLILVPAVARRRQEVARPSVAALSGRVLERPRPRQLPEQVLVFGREREVDGLDETKHVDDRAVDEIDADDGDYDDRRDVRLDDDLRDDDLLDDDLDDHRWERPRPRYRPGRGGFDPEAAAIAARARYAFRQRVVLVLLIIAFVTGVVAAVAVPGLWWLHGAVDIALVGYLGYLRRQVRLEEAIRERRAARMAGTRRSAAADDPELDSYARRGRDLTRRDAYPGDTDYEYLDDRADYGDADYSGTDYSGADDYDDGPADDLPAAEPTRDRRTRDEEPEPADTEPALPRLRPAPPPPLPAGTSLVEVDEDDIELFDLDAPSRTGYRRAAGE